MTDILDTLKTYLDDPAAVMSKRVVAEAIAEITRLRADLAAARAEFEQLAGRFEDVGAELDAARAELAAAQSVAAEHETDAAEIDDERYVACGERNTLLLELEKTRADLAAETERARKLEADGLAKYERIHLLEADLAAANDHANYLAKLESDLIAERDAAEAELAAMRELLREWRAHWPCSPELRVRIDAALNKGGGDE